MSSSQSTEVGRAVPAFKLIAERLTEAILSGRVSGDLPPEKQLAETHGVSRVTMRRALGVVAEAGLAEVTWGRGWTVTHGPLSEPANALLSVTELGAERRLAVESTVLDAHLRPADLDEAEELEIAPGAEIFLLDRVRRYDGVPFTRQLSKLRADRMPGIAEVDFTTASLYATLAERWDIELARADCAVEARSADAEDAELLHVAPGSPLLWAAQRTFDQHGALVEIGWSAFPADRYRFRATLTRRPGQR